MWEVPRRANSDVQVNSERKLKMANRELDQGVINLIDREIAILCNSGVPDISATHVADRVAQRLRVLGAWDTVRNLLVAPPMMHLRNVAAERMAERFEVPVSQSFYVQRCPYGEYEDDGEYQDD